MLVVVGVAGGDAGVVDEYVDVVVGFGDFGEGGGDRVGGGDVHLDGCEEGGVDGVGGGEILDGGLGFGERAGGDDHVVGCGGGAGEEEAGQIA